MGRGVAGRGSIAASPSFLVMLADSVFSRWIKRTCCLASLVCYVTLWAARASVGSEQVYLQKEKKIFLDRVEPDSAQGCFGQVKATRLVHCCSRLSQARSELKSMVRTSSVTHDRGGLFL